MNITKDLIVELHSNEFELAKNILGTQTIKEIEIISNLNTKEYKNGIFSENSKNFLQEIRRKCDESIEKNKNEIRKYVCQDFRYCEKMEAHKDSNFEFHAGIVDGLIACFATSGIPAPIFSSILYLFKHKKLKDFCNC